MWVVFQLKGGMKLAVGIIYMNPENSGNEELDQSIADKIVLEGKILQNKGMNILLIGDFNGHIGEDMLKGGGILNNNGKHFIEISNSLKLSIANCCNVCKGSWTWNRGTERSIIDYLLVDKDLENNMIEMEIDEDANLTIGSDHNWISAKLKVETILLHNRTTHRHGILIKTQIGIYLETNWIMIWQDGVT